ncbi:hypothetical protein L596_016660 [Steinernema carpocapsae]|nr:hypothetical protein L596_016660 [Steinernema carpocapsae]
MVLADPNWEPYHKDKTKEHAEEELKLKKQKSFIPEYDDHKSDEITVTKAPKISEQLSPATQRTEAPTEPPKVFQPPTAMPTMEIVVESPNSSGDMPGYHQITTIVSHAGTRVVESFSEIEVSQDQQQQEEKTKEKVVQAPHSDEVSLLENSFLSVPVETCHNRVVGSEEVRIFEMVDRANKTYKVVCDGKTNGKVWTVIQRRNDSTTFWNRTFAEYAGGFGNPAGSYWLGLDKVYDILASTPDHTMVLRIELRNDICKKSCSDLGEEGYWWGEWFFSIGSKEQNFNLTLSTMQTGNLTAPNNDFFYTLNNGKQFTTVDADNDNSDSYNCAQFRNFGGWWHGGSGCTFTSLNGLYGDKMSRTRHLAWLYQHPPHENRGLMSTYNIKPADTLMMLRPLEVTERLLLLNS